MAASVAVSLFAMSTPSSVVAPWAAALRASLPVGLGYLPAGFAFGVLAVEAGLPAWLAVAMSVFVYAGSLQYAAIPMMASGAGLLSFALAALAINLRHMLYALPMLPWLPRRLALRIYALATLTDETYSLLSSLPATERAALLLPVSLLNQLWWVLGTLAGALAGSAVAHLIPNLHFALPCLFLILAIEQYRGGRLWHPAVAAVVGVLAATWLVPDGHVLMAALGLAVAWLAWRAWREGRP